MDFASRSTSAPAEWAEWAGRNLAVTDDGITLATEPTIEYTDLGFSAIDVDVDRDGTVYALRPSGDVYRYDRQASVAANVWTNGDGETVAEPRALCLAGDRIFVADGADGDLAVVSEREHRSIGRIDADVADLQALVTGHRTVYILDGGPAEGTGRIATLRRRGTVETAISGLSDPRDLAVDPEGNVSVLAMTDDGPVIDRYEARYVASPNAFPESRTVADFAVPDVDETLVPHCIEAISQEELVVHGPLSTSGEAATYHYRFDVDGGRFERRHGLDVRCSRLRAGPRHGRSRYPSYYGVAAEDDRVSAIEERKEYRRNEHTGRFDAQAFRRLDSGSLDTEWHRVTLGFEDLASNTQVLVGYYASDENVQQPDGVELLADVNEHDAADLRAADVESVWDLLETDPETVADVVDGATVERAVEWRRAAVAIIEDRWELKWQELSTTSPTDALFDGATGRYLHVRLHLVGDVDTAPTVGSVRAYCPRQTYLRYLPELFRNDREGTAFLEQFISVFESAYVDVESDIEGLPSILDPAGVPSEYLSWLGTWLAVEADADWPEAARREFLDRAPTLFKHRGTRAGLRAYLELYLRHVEQPDTDWILEWQRRRIEDRRDDGHVSAATAEARLDAVADLESDRDGGHLLFVMEHLDLDDVDAPAAKEPYTRHMRGHRSFTVFAGPFPDRTQREVVDRIVAEEKPAHADGSVVELRQHVKLGGNSFLGINTTLTPRNFVLGRSTLGGDTVLREQDLL